MGAAPRAAATLTIVLSGWGMFVLVVLLVLVAFAMWIATAWAARQVLLDVKRRRLLEIVGLLEEIESLGPDDGARFEPLRWAVAARLDPRWRGLEQLSALLARPQLEAPVYGRVAAGALREARAAVIVCRSWR